MKTLWKYFKWELILAPIVILAMTFFYGLQGGLVATTVLAILEISVSFDNAVVNAGLLEPMTEKQRKWFLLWGMVIAVVGMRLLFPIVIVSLTAWISPIEALRLAFTAPKEYSDHVQSAHYTIAGFGGAFLLMLFAAQFIDADKDEHWFGFIEKHLATLGKIKMAQAAFTLVIVAVFTALMPAEHKVEFVLAALVGIVANIIVGGIKDVMEGSVEATASGVVSGVAASAGIAGLVHIEVVDASFSFDGVIGAFALSNQFIVIAAGLGIGALAVRSLTIFLVDGKALTTLRYLEHGAFWAVGTLGMIMFVNPIFEVPEWFTGIIGAAFIAAAALHSLHVNKQELSGIAAQANDTTATAA
jgi:uncharacterized protein